MFRVQKELKKIRNKLLIYSLVISGGIIYGDVREQRENAQEVDKIEIEQEEEKPDEEILIQKKLTKRRKKYERFNFSNYGRWDGK